MQTMLFTAVQHQLEASTPIWVPIILFVLMILIFVWGLTRGNVLDENRPASGGSSDHNEAHGEGELH